MDYLCDVIVLTWNQRRVIESFVDSFTRNTLVPARLVIVDNGGTDNTMDYLQTLRDTETISFKIISLKENKGFCGGMNAGLAASDAPYVCMANNDLLFTRGWLREVISVFERNKDLGILNPDSNSLGSAPPRGVPLEDYGRSVFEKNKGVFEEIPLCLGFCMVIPRGVVDKIGGLSEEFYPMFFEDSDYGMKAAAAGYRIGVAKGSYVWHQEHASFGQVGSRKEGYFIASRAAFIKKWGDILRVAWVVSDEKEALSCLDQAVELARGGNFVWFFLKRMGLAADELFRQKNYVKHAGVRFVVYGNPLNLIWLVLKKKKKYHLIIVKSNPLRRFFSKIGYSVLAGYDPRKITSIKRGGRS